MEKNNDNDTNNQAVDETEENNKFDNTPSDSEFVSDTSLSGNNQESFGIDDVAVNTNPEDNENYDSDDDLDYDDEFDGEAFEQNILLLRAQKAQKKAEFIKRIIIACIILAITASIIVFVSITNTGIIGAYKTNFIKNMRQLFPESEQSVDIGATEKNTDSQQYVNNDTETSVKVYDNTNANTVILPFEGAAAGKFSSYRNGLVCARTNYICFINSNGEIELEQNTTIVDPLLSTNGKYIALASENGNKLCLYYDSELLYETDTENTIKSMHVSSKGDVILICDKPGYKGSVSVYNKDGQEIFAWSSGQNNIINADISSASRHIAVSLINTDRNVYSIIKLFDIRTGESNAESAFEDTILFSVDYTGDTITAFGDNSIVCMSSTGRVINDKRFDMVSILHYASDSSGNKLIHFDSASIPVFHVYSKKGNLLNEIITDNISDCIDIYGNYILYNSGRDVLLRKAGSDRIKAYTATMDILNLVLINNNTYAVIHSNCVEIVRI